MLAGRKGSDASKILCLCSSCEVVIDNDPIVCSLCKRNFHTKKECSAIPANVVKTVIASENISYLCNACKSTSLSDMFNRLSIIEQEIVSLREQLKAQVNSDIGRIIHQAIEEHEQRIDKRCNVMIFGLRESTFDEEDEDITDDLFDEMNIDREQISYHKRVGIKKDNAKWPRPIRLRFKTVENKQQCLHKSRNLRKSERFGKVFVRTDLTRAQQEFNKRLIEELNTRKNAGENVMIRQGKIVQCE